MTCDHCRVAIEAEFPRTRLGQLPLEHQRFIEIFILASGSLKEIAAQTGVSYPTVRPFGPYHCRSSKANRRGCAERELCDGTAEASPYQFNVAQVAHVRCLNR